MFCTNSYVKNKKYAQMIKNIQGQYMSFFYQQYTTFFFVQIYELKASNSVMYHLVGPCQKIEQGLKMDH